MPANQRPQSHHEGSKKDLEKEKETTPTGGQRPSQDQQSLKRAMELKKQLRMNI